MSDSFRPQGLQHARPPCPSLTPGVTQTHVHWVSDAIQPSHPLPSPSPPAFSLSQHQGLFVDLSRVPFIETHLILTQLYKIPINSVPNLRMGKLRPRPCPGSHAGRQAGHSSPPEGPAPPPRSHTQDFLAEASASSAPTLADGT